jgi:uncharacterized iron-regulated membrane protein
VSSDLNLGRPSQAARAPGRRGEHVSVRSVFVFLHRWVGLAIAGFLFTAGLTGALISWDRELDGWLNPNFWRASSRGEILSPYDLAARVEAADPRAFVTYLPLHAEAGKAIFVVVDPRVDPATGKLFRLGYNQVFVDPVSGEILGRREWGAIGLDRAHLIPFLYKFHYSLCIPELWGVDEWGVWLMGGVALLWIFDCFIGFYVTLPPRRRELRSREPTFWSRWRPAWRIRWTSTPYRAAFDVHRAFGLWLWAFLFILAVTAASLNLYKEVAQPIVAFFSTFTPTPADLRTPRPMNDPIMPRVTMSEIAARAREEGLRRQWSDPPGVVRYGERFGVYSVGFFSLGGDHGAAGVGPAELYFDSEDGRLLGDRLPWRGSAGDLFLQIQFPLHSGRIAGLAGRIVISCMGLVVAALSVTGVVIWLKKRRARRKSQELRSDAMGRIESAGAAGE